MKTLLLTIALFSFTYMANAQTKEPAKLLRHAVLLKFKDSSSPADVKKVEDAFRALKSQIKEIEGFEWGTNNSPENLNQGFTHLFFVTFKSEKDREIYLPHPAHKAFVGVLGPHLDKVLVLDYWASK
ncbi:Dabb family protein [Emticicia sp. C21]|uniref:Dabb family protein n=1 Tax=Emticicia sp. C21 TaxID=2302915 RepID=UPI000E34E107|nr:Dabb family protein [Emticicia sp. C21]RFS15394.1 Dabb family protein [Emticicia sp. C21]